MSHIKTGENYWPDDPVFTLNSQMKSVVCSQSHEQAEDHFTDLTSVAKNIQVLVVVVLWQKD